jgi:hypothetical protein
LGPGNSAHLSGSMTILRLHMGIKILEEDLTYVAYLDKRSPLDRESYSSFLEILDSEVRYKIITTVINRGHMQ